MQVKSCYGIINVWTPSGIALYGCPHVSFLLLLLCAGKLRHEGIHFLIADFYSFLFRSSQILVLTSDPFSGAKSRAAPQPTIAPPTKAEINVSALI